MKFSDIVRNALYEWMPVDEKRDGVLVTTQCLYPSNGFVQVAVRGGVNAFHVSDEGGAIQEISGSGIHVSNPDTIVRHWLPEGCIVRGGIIRTENPVSLQELSVMIAIVANASKEVADALFDRLPVKRDRDFKRVVSDFLQKRFDDHVKHNELIVGASNTPHKFENVIALPNGKRLIVDPVLHEASSINARLVANLDVKNAKRKDIVQRIVFDDDEDWKPADLSLLSVGATAIPFSESRGVLDRLTSGQL